MFYRRLGSQRPRCSDTARQTHRLCPTRSQWVGTYSGNRGTGPPVQDRNSARFEIEAVLGQEADHIEVTFLVALVTPGRVAFGLKSTARGFAIGGPAIRL
jgi:hypothetical protein